MFNCDDYKHNLTLIVIVSLIIIFITGQYEGKPSSGPIVIPVG